MRRRAASVTAVVAALAAMCGACSKTETATTPAKQIREVTLPDLTRMDATVQQQIRDRYASVIEARKTGAGDADLSEKYGQYGMVHVVLGALADVLQVEVHRLGVRRPLADHARTVPRVAVVH